MALSKLDLTEAGRVFAVANTPLFIVRKLQGSPSVTEVARDYSSARILASLSRALKSKPRDFISHVRPYVYLLGLAEKRDAAALAQAAMLASPHHKWFPDIVQWVVKSGVPTNYANVDARQGSTKLSIEGSNAPSVIILGET